MNDYVDDDEIIAHIIYKLDLYRLANKIKIRKKDREILFLSQL